MIPAPLLWLGSIWFGNFAVGITSNPDLQWGPAHADAAERVWMQVWAATRPDLKARPAARRISGSAARPATQPRALPRDGRVDEHLFFELRSLQVPQVSVLARDFEAWLRREIARGWRTEGEFGLVRADGTRRATFIRRRRSRVGWRNGGVARSIPCTPALRRPNTVGCYLVTPDSPDGSTVIKLGPQRHPSVFPRVVVALDSTEGGLMARIRALVIVPRADLELLIGTGFWARLIRPFLMVDDAPDARDADGDGRADAWQLEIAATMAVRPSPAWRTRHERRANWP